MVAISETFPQPPHPLSTKLGTHNYPMFDPMRLFLCLLIGVHAQSTYPEYTSCTSCLKGYYYAYWCPSDNKCYKYSSSCSGSTISYSSSCPRFYVCDAGYYNKDEGSSSSSCSICQGGTFSSSGSNFCTSCLEGYYAPSGSSSCSPCESGTYSSQPGSSSCTPCKASYISYTAATSCTRLAPLTCSDFEGVPKFKCMAGDLGKVIDSSIVAGAVCVALFSVFLACALYYYVLHAPHRLLPGVVSQGTSAGGGGVKVKTLAQRSSPLPPPCPSPSRTTPPNFSPTLPSWGGAL